MTGDFTINPEGLHKVARDVDDSGRALHDCGTSLNAPAGNPQFPFSASADATMAHFRSQLETLSSNVHGTAQGIEDAAALHARMEQRNVEGARSLGQVI